MILGTISALIVANVSYFLFRNTIVSAFLATGADFIVGYGTIAYRDIKSRKDKGLGFAGFLKVIRNMVVEFGPGEYLDSFVFRPFYFSIFPYLIHNYSLAILAGSLTAEITYFVPVIIFYEARKKIFKD